MADDPWGSGTADGFGNGTADNNDPWSSNGAAADSFGGDANGFGDGDAKDTAEPAAVEAAAPDPADEAAMAEFLAKRQKEIEEGRQKAKEAGWTEQTPYTYTQAGGDAPRSAAEGDSGEPVPKWLSDAAVYEWDDDFGEIGPVNVELERELFHGDHLMRAGGAIRALEYKVDITLPDNGMKLAPIMNFSDAGLHPAMLENVKLCKYNAPTPIQMYCIPAVLTGHDVLAIAQTGSGKTAAYLIPILSRLMGKAKLLAAPRPNAKDFDRMTNRVRAEPLVLVVCPTRELACQIFDDARRLCYRTMLRPCVIYGGAPPRVQREQLEMGCDILIATPGRLVDFMRQPNLLSFSRLKFTVLDEADELLSGGWEEALEMICTGGDTNEDDDHTYLMFSATFPKAARRLAKEFMAEDVVKIKVGRVGSTHGNIQQTLVWVDEHAKNQALLDLIMAGGPRRSLIFVNSKRKAEIVDDFLYGNGLPSTSIHSDRTQREREDALRSFKLGKCPLLVATGVTARGLDVKDVRHVINYDLPSTQHGGIDEYVHRIGRTARIGNLGLATSFYNESNEDLADDLVKIFVENKQQVPDFLQDRVPEKVEWDEQGTDDETEVGDFGDAGGFGDTEQADNGFGGDGGFQADGGDGGFQADEGVKLDEGFGGGGFEQADDSNKMASW